MGVEWDLTWTLEKLSAELKAAMNSGKRGVSIPRDRMRRLRYIIYHINVDRIECYEKPLLVGQFKLRMTLACPGSKRTPFSWESDRPFHGYTCLKADEGSFRLPVPVNVHGKADQLFEWRVEIELLHKYPAAPIYSVVGRSWVDPVYLGKALAVDIYSTSDLQNTLVRINFAKTSNSPVPVNLFRTAGLAVLWLARLGRQLGESRRNEIAELEREVRLLNVRNKTFQQSVQSDLMVRTIQTMNKYIESGSKPEDWIHAMQKAGVLGEDSQRRVDAQIRILREQIESLRNDVLKSVVERPPPVVNVMASSGPRDVLSPPIPEEPSAAPPQVLQKPMTASEPGKEFLRKPPMLSVITVPPIEASAIPSADSRVKLNELAIASEKRIPEKLESEHSRGLEEAEGSHGENEDEAEPNEGEEAAEPDITTTVTNTMMSWWGAMTSTGEPAKSSDEPSAKAIPKKATLKAPPVVKKSGLSAAPLVAAVTKPPPTAAIAKKGMPPPKSAKAKIDPLKAKMELVQKVKMLEAKRKAEVFVAEKKIAELAKKLPPVDMSKFIGLPGPPPFAPKSKAVVPSEQLIPQSIAPPSSEDLEEVELEE